MEYQVKKHTIENILHMFEGNIPSENLEVCDIVEARRIMELSMIKIVIERVEEENIQELSHLVEEMDACIEDGKVFADLDGHFHMQLMGCAKNQVLILFVATLNDMIDRDVLRKNYDIRINAQNEHKNILEAVKERDSRKLKEALNAHLLCFKSLYF